MAYAALQDIIDRYGEDALYIVADRDGDDSIDTVVVERALNDAADEINTYIGKKYSLPLSTTPSLLTRLSVDIALYRLSPEGGYTEEKRTRYEDAVRVLKGLANGDASLGLPEAQTPEVTAGDVELVTSKREFSRRTMGRLV